MERSRGSLGCQKRKPTMTTVEQNMSQPEGWDPVGDWEIGAMFLDDNKDGPSELFGALMHDEGFRKEFQAGMGRKIKPTKDRLELMALGAEWCNATQTTTEELEKTLRKMREEHDAKQAAKRAKKAEETAARDAEQEGKKEAKCEEIREVYRNCLPDTLAGRKIEELDEAKMSLFELGQLLNELEKKQIRARREVTALSSQRARGIRTFDELRPLLERSFGGRFESDFQAKFWTKLDGRPESKIMKDLNNELNPSAPKQAKKKKAVGPPARWRK